MFNKNCKISETYATNQRDGCAYMAIKLGFLPLSQDWSDWSCRPISHPHLRPMVSGTHMSSQPPFKISQEPEFMKQNTKETLHKIMVK